MCCGNKREQLQNNYSKYNTDIVIGSAFPAEEVSFEYTGEKSLTVKGGITRKQYFFSQKGDIKSVSYNDAPGMTGVPNLRKLKVTGIVNSE